MSTLDALPVEFLFRMELDLGEKQVMPRGPQGTRVYAQVAGGRVEGPRLKGTVAPGADWVTVRADGSAQLDVRLVITADDAQSSSCNTKVFSGLMAFLGQRHCSKLLQNNING